ncbi:tRNA pseudouridine(55) synthase TruB [Salinicoccus sp. CNSTN-B1]
MHGVIPVNKDKGLTSHDVVMRMRRILGMKKVGHTGTLDPEVTGVLPIVVGEGTKLTEYLQTKKKSYRARVTLGYSTDTEDQTGQVEDSNATDGITDAMIDEAIVAFQGDYTQRVPRYASVKINGKKLYEYARQGIEVERPLRTVSIFQISRIGPIERESGLIHFDIDVTCSKGTYIRTLAVDIGRSLETAAHMSALIRTESCGITLNQSASLEELKAGDATAHLIPIGKLIEELPTVDIEDENFLKKILNGQKVYKSAIMEMVEDRTDKVVFRNEGKVIGIYHDHPEKQDMMKPYKMFNL